MSTTDLSSVPDTAVDTSGLSIVTSTPAAISDEDGRGAIYSPAVLAAGRLVHTHAVEAHQFLAIFSDTWINATANQSVPGTFSAKTALNRPVAFWVNSRAGGRTPAMDQGGEPSHLFPRRTISLVAATSMGPMLYLLVIVDGKNPALLNYRTAPGVLAFISAQWLPGAIVDDATDPVVWDKGIFQSGAYLYFVGAAANDRLCMAKYPLSAPRSKPLYLGAKGWTPNPSEIVPLATRTGAPLTSIGPVSLARYQSEWYLSATARPATETTASFYRAAHPSSGWAPLPGTVTLGTDAAAVSTGVFFQDSVEANPRHQVLAGNAEAVAGLPYVHTVQADTAMRTAWGILPVPRQRM